MSDAESRQAFHRPHTFSGPVAHIARTVTSLSPLLPYEFVKDPHKQQRWARVAIITATGVEQTLWAMKVQRQNHEREDCGR